MVSAAYDNLVAIMVVGVIFVGTVVALPAMSYSNLQTVEQQQIRNIALDVFESMLLGVGSPANWGFEPQPFNASNVIEFGLARASPFSKYVLDPDKVQRVAPENNELGYEDIRTLLKLKDYGFRFSLTRPFRVETADLDIDKVAGNIEFSVNVTRAEDATPIPNARVDVTVLVTSSTLSESAGPYKPIGPVTFSTDTKGICQGNILAGFPINSAIAIMQITVGGLSTTVVEQDAESFTKYLQIRTYGDNVTLGIRALNLTKEEQQEIGKSKRDLNYSAVYVAGRIVPIHDELEDGGRINHGEGFETQNMTYRGLRALNPTVLIFVLTVRGMGGGGPREVLVAGPMFFGDSEEIYGFGPEPGSRNVIATMRRLVVISDMTYIAQISFWREQT